MRIIRPYGRSAVRPARRRRTLVERSAAGRERDLDEFAHSHAALVIAQWISAIDKIAAKPTGNRKPTQAQRDLRKRLGDAAWACLVENDLLGESADNETTLEELWRFKVEPYPNGNALPGKDRNGNPKPEPGPRGRWYARFAGDVEPCLVDARDVVRKIHAHLYEAEYRIAGHRPNKRRGRITARAESIAGNILQRPARHDDNPPWSEDDKAAYSAPGDVAATIRARAMETEKNRKQIVFMRDVSPVLFEHYGRLFQDDHGAALPIKEAQSRHRGTSALHEAVKEVYRRRLSGHKSIKHKSVAGALPADMQALFTLIDKTHANRNLNGLVRLGKVIHYEAAAAAEAQETSGAASASAHVLGHWPENVSQSRYWSSDGQADIKRNEAFTRVWRHVLALAARTLTDWADPQGKQTNDILGGDQIQAITGTEFRLDACRRKLDLLFGSHACLFKSASNPAGGAPNGDLERRVLRFALEGIARLRNSAFHFKGLGGFALALECALQDDGLRDAITRLWTSDRDGRAGRLRETMRAAHFEHFFNKAQNRKFLDVIWQSVSHPGTADVPLPRFSRLLKRASNIKDDASPVLPEPVNRSALEQPARRCQYTAMKLLYERPFRDWLAARPAAELNGFIDKAVNRTTEAARDMNAKDDERRKSAIRAKAKHLGKLGDGDTMRRFLSRLSAETASEMRVQRGYDSDPDRAREQARYIDDLALDVIARAFDSYLDKEELGFVQELPMDTPDDVPDRQCGLDVLTPEVPSGAAATDDWQLVLYFLAHLVPVDDVASLRHQMRKWEILADRPDPGPGEARAPGPMLERVRGIQKVLDLYLDMHDAKFEGNAALTGIAEFRKFFQGGESFDRIFPLQPGGDDDDGRLPRRGLREIMRFGHLRPLGNVFMQHPVTEAEVQGCEQAEKRDSDGSSPIARWQKAREDLHDKWAASRQDFDASDLRAYVRALAGVVRHRHGSARVTLTDHVRVHRLLMTVLGRLVDFAGLWERDLYFVTLALMHRNGSEPSGVFKGKGCRTLSEGRIVEALRNLNETAEAQSVRNGLQRYFGDAFRPGNGQVARIRNRLAHFNMLRSDAPVNLTAEVNEARRLMAYDRKLKNAVSKSVIELLHREGLMLKWAMTGADHPHQLGAARLATRRARHLGETQLRKKGAGRSSSYPIEENLHGDGFLKMAAALFEPVNPVFGNDVASLDVSKIDWNRSTRSRKGKGGSKAGRGRNKQGRSRKRARKS